MLKEILQNHFNRIKKILEEEIKDEEELQMKVSMEELRFQIEYINLYDDKLNSEVLN